LFSEKVQKEITGIKQIHNSDTKFPKIILNTLATKVDSIESPISEFHIRIKKFEDIGVIQMNSTNEAKIIFNEIFVNFSDGFFIFEKKDIQDKKCLYRKEKTRDLILCVKDNLIFEIDRDRREYGLVLGYGSLYQHSEEPNMEFGYNKSNKQMYFTATRMIRAGEELTINYGKEYWDERKSFNTIAPMPEPEKTEELEENGMGLPANAAMISGAGRTKGFGDIRNPANPAISGVAIMGAGQS